MDPSQVVNTVEPYARASLSSFRSKYDPVGADREAFKRAKATNRVSEYWEAREAEYQKNVGQRFTRPPGTRAPADATS